MDFSRKEMIEDIFSRLGELSRLANNGRDEIYAKYNLSRSQAELLFAITKCGRMTVTDLADTFAITPSAISQMVSNLEEKRLVNRIQDKEDRRVTFIELSNVAKSHFAKMRRALLTRLDQKLEDMNSHELNKLQKNLTQITKRLGN